MAATVAVVGGGYGGITAAKSLDDVADVVLIDPKDSFVHNVASLRAFVDASWADKMFFPYDKLLKNGRTIQDSAVSVSDAGVHLVSGEFVPADFIVIATGTAYPFPAKMFSNHAETAIRRIRTASQELANARDILLLGAGPVGLELAGEIKAVWPDRPITIIDPAPEVLSSSFMPDVPLDVRATIRNDLRRQLHELGIELRLGVSVSRQLPIPAGKVAKFSVPTSAGRTLYADMWLKCFGRQPSSGCLAPNLVAARRRDSLLRVTENLLLAGQHNVFAIGDVTATGALDTAVVAIEQAEFVANEIRGLLTGRPQWQTYRPSQPAFLVPLGPKGGASYDPENGILDAQTTAQYKGGDMLTGKFGEMFQEGS